VTHHSENVIALLQLRVAEDCRLATRDTIPALPVRIIDVAARGHNDISSASAEAEMGASTVYLRTIAAVD
jgi:hypothetical protein